MEGKYIAGIAAILVAVILVGSVLAPVIDTVSGGAWDETITTTYNEDPDLQFDKQTSDFALNMSVTIGDDVTITNGEDTVTAPYGAMFLLAADNSAIFISVADDLIFTWSDNDGKHSLTLAGDFTAVIADDKLTVNDGTAHDAPLPASYLYVPSSTGGYGSFASGDLAKRAADPVIAAGSFAGAVAYNSSVTLVGDAMVMSADATDTLITSVEWIKTPAAEPAVIPLDPSSITIQPLDPSVIDPTPDASITAVNPNPQYTDGYWGYNLITSGAYQGKARIVSYSGPGGGPITVPATVGGYDVAELGSNNAYTVFDTTLSATDLIISEGVQNITFLAFDKCSGFTGNLILPDSLTTIGGSAFRDCTGFTGNLILPDSLTTIEGSFTGCSGFTGNLILPDSLTTIESTSFFKCTGLDGVIYLPDSITTIGGSAFGQVGSNYLISSLNDGISADSTAFNNTHIRQILNIGTLNVNSAFTALASVETHDYIGADCYIAPATITEVIHHSGGGGGMGAMYAAIPVVILAAILLAAVSMFVIRRGM